MPPKILVIVGPTASGKTRLAVELAHEWNGRGGLRRLHAGLPPHGHRHGQAHSGRRWTGSHTT